MYTITRNSVKSSITEILGGAMPDPAVRISRIISDGKPTRTYEQGRVCVVPHCITKLSLTNPGPACRVHTPPKKVRRRV